AASHARSAARAASAASGCPAPARSAHSRATDAACIARSAARRALAASGAQAGRVSVLGAAATGVMISALLLDRGGSLSPACHREVGAAWGKMHLLWVKAAPSQVGADVRVAVPSPAPPDGTGCDPFRAPASRCRAVIAWSKQGPFPSELRYGNAWS